jgi:Na+-driven multidrug efflux pump
VTLGVSPFIMQSTESLLNITFNRSLQLYGGDLAVGAMTITASLMQMLILPLMGLSQGAQPIMSYNYGAGNITRVKQTFKLLFISSLSYSFLFWLSLKLFPHVFIGFFTNGQTLINITTDTISIYMAVVFLFGAQISCQQAFIALSEARVSLFLALLRKIILLIPLILILPRFIDNQTFAVLVSEPIADFISVVTTVTVFFYLFNKILLKRKQTLVNETTIK